MPITYEQIEAEAVAETLQFGYNVGKDAAKRFLEMVENGEVDLKKPCILHIPMSKFIPEKNLSAKTRFLMTFGTEEAGMTGNTALVCAGVYTCGNSLLQLSYATDKKAKFCYQVSVICSLTAVGSGSIAVAARACSISRTALLTEAAGYAFMRLGNEARDAALKFEGKKVPKRSAYYFRNTKDVSFIAPPNIAFSSIIEKIPFQQIGRVVGFTVSVYCYGKLVIKVYRYCQQLISKYKRRKFLKTAKVLTVALYNCPSLCQYRRRVAAVYRFALS